MATGLWAALREAAEALTDAAHMVDGAVAARDAREVSIALSDLQGAVDAIEDALAAAEEEGEGA